MAAAILLTLSFDQNRKLLIYVEICSVFALEKSKIITLYKRSAYCFLIKLCTCTAFKWLLLAHLSQRLIGELIGYSWSGVRPS